MKLGEVLQVVRIDRILLAIVKGIFGGGKKGGKSDCPETSASKEDK